MPSTYLFDQVSSLKEKFKIFLSHRKKMQALDNYSSCAPFQHRDFLILIKRCMRDGFLGEKEGEFLAYMVEKYAINFLDWSHKTPWLKSEMKRLSAHYPRPQINERKIAQLPLFDYDKLKGAPTCAQQFEIFAQKTKQMRVTA